MRNSEAATGTADAPAGRVASFGKYLLLQRVSIGGMAEVFKAIPEGATRIDQIVAIKRILPNIAEDREFIGMFIDEARIAGQLTHPNICRIYELGRVGADHYIAMQFLWGRDLLKVMNRFKRAGLLVPPPMAAFIAAHAAAALHYAHNKCDASGAPLHIIHRDVSPQNIIVGYSGQAKLIDFGVARAASQSQKTQAGILKGKFGYMSPEMIRGLPVDHRSDVFAMGICLHEALTGSRLFYGETDFATLELVRDAKILPPSTKAPGVVPALDAIVMKALARDAEQRYQSAHELAEALDVFLEEHYPGYGEDDVSAAMREAFAHELSREKLRLDAIADMLERGALVRGAALPALPSEPPPSGERHAAESSAKAESGPPNSVPPTSEPPPQEEGDLSEEQTQIFFSSAELNELRQLDVQLSEQAQRPPQVSDVIMRASSGFTTPPPPMMPAPSFAGLTPSGTYPRRADESSRVPLAPQFGVRRSSEHAIRTQTLPIYRPTPSEDEALDAAEFRSDARRGNVRTLLLMVAALAVAALGYTIVSMGTKRGATLQIARVSDPGALVRVDGVVRGNPPLSIEDIAPGVHVIEIEASGYQLARAKVAIEPGTTRSVQLELARIPGPLVDTLTPKASAPPGESEAQPEQAPPPVAAPAVRPALRARPEPSDEKVAPAARASAPPAAPQRPERAPEAPASQEPQASDAQGTGEPASPAEPPASPASPESSASSGETQVGEAVNEETKAAGQGELLISTVPWSHVIIDGVDTGRDTPVRALRVAAGEHTLVLRTPDGEEHTIPLSVAPGKTVRIIRRF